MVGIEWGFRIFISCNIKHPHMELCSYIVEQLDIDSIESYKEFDFNTLNGEIPKSKIEAFIELQNRL
jgi:hypothetical protein